MQRARLAREVAALLADRRAPCGDGAASRSLARPEAAQDVAGELLAAATRERERARDATPTPERPWEGRRLHFVGVGGAGMSGYARAAHALGATVSGSDRTSSPYLERFASTACWTHGSAHDAANVPAGEDVEVVYSSAVAAENPERVAARERGLRERPRAELLGELSALRRTIAVAGTHGKTTTSAMVVTRCAPPAWSPIGWSAAGRRRAGERELERRGSGWSSRPTSPTARCSALHVEVAVLTNVELDHHASFGSLVELREAFRAFLAAGRDARRPLGSPRAAGAERARGRTAGHGRGRPLRRARPALIEGGSRFAGANTRSRCRCPARTTP